MLLNRFKKTVLKIIKTLTTTRYIYKNVRRRHDLINYVFIIIKTARFIQLSTYNQLFFIYNNLKIEFRRNFIMSTKTTTINTFFKEIKTKKRYNKI